MQEQMNEEINTGLEKLEEEKAEKIKQLRQKS